MHSLIPPSSAHIWGSTYGCSGWVAMSMAYPDTEDSEAAREGTASHEIGAELIRAAQRFNTDAPKKEALIGKVHDNGVVYTDEMFDAAEVYAANVIEVMDRTKVWHGPDIGVEQRIHAARIHKEHSWGTPDSYLYDRAGKTLYVWDYKYGMLEVEAFENRQLINYVAGLFDKFGIDGLLDQEITVVIRIVQPRVYRSSGPVDEWVVKGDELRGYINTLSNGAEKALGTKPETHTGAHCRFCNAVVGCEAARKAGLQFFEVTSRPVPDELPPDALGWYLGLLKRAKKHIETLEAAYSEEAAAVIRSGKSVPGWALKPGRGKKEWSISATEVIALGQSVGVDLDKHAVITPTQAIDAGMDKETVNGYTQSIPGALKVTEDKNNLARKVFGPKGK
jgi:hypothetical protein